MKMHAAFRVLATAILFAGGGFQVEASPRLGRAVVAGVEGKATAQTPEGSFDVVEGMALSHGRTITTGADSSVCSVLTPGALLCIHANSRVEFTDLQHVIEGLPGEGGREKGRISLYLERGAMLVHGLKGPENLSIDITLQPPVHLQANRAEFVVARDRDRWQVFVEKGDVVLQNGTEPRSVHEGQTMVVVPPPRAGDVWGIAVSDGLANESTYSFYVCRSLFPALTPLAEDWSWDALGEGAAIVSDGARLAYLTRAIESLDVSPSSRDQSLSPAETPQPAMPARVAEGGARRRVDMWQWYRGVGALRGVNYLPRTAVNPTEMWQRETFDRQTIDQELGWAHDSGLNSVRVFLPFLVWQQDPDGFKSRFTDFLKLVDQHQLTAVPVLFDDYSPSGSDPYLGPQKAPLDKVHNSQWTPSPGHALVTDTSAWPALESYVKDMVGSFGSDKRVLFWDLYNDPGRSGMGEKSLPLVQSSFDWAREQRPSQPLTAGVNAFLNTESIADIMRRSDLVTFSGYHSKAELEGGMSLAGMRGRPVVCTGWLDRTQDLTFESTLPLFAQNHVGWYEWGLVAGRSQLHVPVSGAGAAPEGLWPQSILKDDGKPYDDREVRLIRQFMFEER
ncbi:MAG: hypothetical protein K8T26_18070 [Lentisphaerae bacterium]|nr:hypothetical protein [Lentisphaerota bacterium]